MIFAQGGPPQDINGWIIGIGGVVTGLISAVISGYIAYIQAKAKTRAEMGKSEAQTETRRASAEQRRNDALYEQYKEQFERWRSDYNRAKQEHDEDKKLLAAKEAALLICREQNATLTERSAHLLAVNQELLTRITHLENTAKK